MGTLHWYNDLELMLMAIRAFGRGRYDKKLLVSEILFDETLGVATRIDLINSMRVEEDSDEFKDRMVLEKMEKL